MATIHKISEEFVVDSFELVALHCNMEAYAVAYHINRMAGLKLTRAENDLQIENIFFPIYEWKDDFKDQEWCLVSNKVIQEQEEYTGLFVNNKTSRPSYLIAEKKQINYILRLTPENTSELNEAIESIREIPKMSMAYRLDVEALKSKRNLIF